MNSVEDFEVIEIRHDLSAATLSAADIADVIVLDTQFPEPPLDFVSEANERFPETRVVVVQAPEFPQHVLPYIEAGAVGHVEGSSSFNELVGILKTVHRGGAVIDPTLANMVIKQMIQLSNELGSPLTPADAEHELTSREMEVLAEAAEGKSNAEIGEALFIQEGTVKNHVHNILRKLDLRDRGQAALWYAQWQRMQRTQEEDGAESPEADSLAPAAYMQQISSIAHPRGMIFAATAMAPVRDGVERALNVLCEQLDWPIGHVFLLDENINRLASSGIWKLPTPTSFAELQITIANLQIPLDDEYKGISVRQGHPIYITDIQQETHDILAELANSGEIRSLLMVPLSLDEAVIGLMAFFSTTIEDEPSDAVYEGLQEAVSEVSEFIEEPETILDLGQIPQRDS
ncbi:MAG: LuxR C-terminal-related transcriptional regulator [Thermomicrobiales bacterium]